MPLLASSPEKRSAKSQIDIPIRTSPLPALIHATLERETLHASLNDGELLGPLSDAFRQALEAELEPMTLYSGEFLFRKGDASDSLYIVLSGRLRVLPEDPAHETLPVELGRGETIGELGLITGEPRSRSICAVRDTYLGRLSSAAYDQLLTRYPQEVMRIFVSRIARRVQQVTAGTLRASSRINNIALIPASPGAAFKIFCDQFCEALASLRFGRAGLQRPRRCGLWRRRVRPNVRLGRQPDSFHRLAKRFGEQPQLRGV